MRKLICFLYTLLFSVPAVLTAQNKTISKDEVKVFVDCSGWCDMNFIKTEINYVDFVPDRFSANVFIMVTDQRTGSGGSELKLFFNGQENFKGMQDTLKFYRTSVDTDAEYREKLVRYLKLGLTRFVAQTSLAQKIDISVRVSKNEEPSNSLSNKKDKWNFWVFNVGFSGNINSDDYSKSNRISGSIRANRVTEKLKISINANVSKNVRTIQFDSTISKFPNNNSGIYTTIVKSLSSHWSVGGKASFNHSTYSNTDSRLSVRPAVEYSFFKYKDAVKKSITLFYSIGPSLNNYIDSGYYDKPEHLLFEQSLSLNVGFLQKWGNVNLEASYNNYLNSFSLNDVKIKGKNINTFSVGGYIEVRIIKGLSLDVSANANFTKGIYPNIPRKFFSRDDLLTNTRQYPTEKGLYTYFGINYRFGSIYNNVVNPRFNGSNF